MTDHRRTSRRPRLLALVAGTALALAGLASAGAQMPPYTAYGMGLRAGEVVVASIEGVECGRTRVSAAGNWKISIPSDAPCQPVDGSTIGFEVDGVKHSVTARWSGGGAPPNPRAGIALGAAPAAAAKPAPTIAAKPAVAPPRPAAVAIGTPTPRVTPWPKTRPGLFAPPARIPFR